MAGHHQHGRRETMTSRDPRQSSPAGQAADDFQKIAGIGQAIERRLHDAGILTYRDLAARSPEQIAASLADVAGFSSARIASQDWAGQAGRLAGSAAPSLPSEPDQHYASFHIELLLDVDGSVRRTKVHHHQSDKDEAWPGWDEGRLIALLRDHIPLLAPGQQAEAPGQPGEAPGLPSSATTATPPTDQQEAAAPSRGEMETAELPVSLPSSFLRIENLGLTREGQRSRRYAPGEPATISFTLHVIQADTQAATFDFTADVTASSELGDDQRQLLGTVQGPIRAGEPLPVELAGAPLPRGLYRLEAAVTIYPADHTGDSKPLQSRRKTGAFVQVADVPAQPVPART
jgi:predicted flap endonuclease-1-like 5' DNA nuclease